MHKLIFAFAAFSGLASVVLGAFASHGLKQLPAPTLHAFETGVHYQMSHSLVLLVTCVLLELWGRHWALVYASYAFVFGIILFSGSLYLLALTGMKWLGPVTPLGGLGLIAGWLLLLVGIWRNVPASS